MSRAIDLLLIFLVSIPTLPVAIIIFIILYLRHGEAIYKQSRVGFGGKQFSLYKFKTMAVWDEEQLNEYLSKLKPEEVHYFVTMRRFNNDPRVDTFSRFLRITKLDEIPQFYNIALGDMTFVGLRPVIAEELGVYQNHNIQYTDFTPGLTGLFQLLNCKTIETQLFWDKLYVNNKSIWLNMCIIFLTPIFILLQVFGLSDLCEKKLRRYISTNSKSNFTV